MDVIPLAFLYGAALLVGGLLHGRVACWIQVANYLAASVPLALATREARLFRKTRVPQRRRLVLWYLGIAAAVAGYAAWRVEVHKGLIATEEVSYRGIIEALDRHHAAHGAYPSALAAAGLTAPSATRYAHTFHYEADADGRAFRVTFTHNLVLRRVFDSRTHVWEDAN